MKSLICLVLSIFIAFSFSATVTTASASCVYKKVCKKTTHRYRHTCSRTYYAPGYCKQVASSCGGDVVCYPGRYYSCYTDFYYHSGRNTARVEICR